MNQKILRNILQSIIKIKKILKKKKNIVLHLHLQMKKKIILIKRIYNKRIN
jgi:hypothetical protein